MVRAKLSNVEIRGRSESCEKGNCQVRDFICDTDNFSTKSCGEIFKIQSGVLNFNSKKVVYLLKCRICGEAPYVAKAKAQFRARFNNYKSAHRSFRKKCKVSQQRFHEHYGQHSYNGIDDWQFTLTGQCKTHQSGKRGKVFGNTGLKRFTLVGLMKKENVYIKSPFVTFPQLGTQFFNHFKYYCCLIFYFIFFFIGYTLRSPLGYWSLCYVFIWHHLTMVPRK